MPTILTHALLPLIAAAAVEDSKLSRRLVVVGMIAAVLPDADLISRAFGIPHTHDFGHRGVSHSLLFALLIGALGVLAAPMLNAGRRASFWFPFLSCVSHPLTDMLTNGGKGIMLLWPLAHDRFTWPLRPVEVSPIGLRSIDDGSIDAADQDTYTLRLTKAPTAPVTIALLSDGLADVVTGGRGLRDDRPDAGALDVRVRRVPEPQVLLLQHDERLGDGVAVQLRHHGVASQEQHRGHEGRQQRDHRRQPPGRRPADLGSPDVARAARLHRRLPDRAE